MTKWRYEDVYQGSIYAGFVMAGTRVVASIEYVGSRRTPENVERSRRELRGIVEAKAEVERLRTTVDKLPKTADGVRIIFGIKLWTRHFGKAIRTQPGAFIVTSIDSDGLLGGTAYPQGGEVMAFAEHSYSTLEAAKLAGGECERSRTRAN